MLAFLIRAYEWVLRRLCGPVRGPDDVPVEYWPDFRRRDARALVERMGRILPWAWTWDERVDRGGQPRPALPFKRIELFPATDGQELYFESSSTECSGSTSTTRSASACWLSSRLRC